MGASLTRNPLGSLTLVERQRATRFEELDLDLVPSLHDAHHALRIENENALPLRGWFIRQ